MLLDGEMALGEAVLRIDEVDRLFAVDLDDDVIAVGDDFLGEPLVRLVQLSLTIILSQLILVR